MNSMEESKSVVITPDVIIGGTTIGGNESIKSNYIPVEGISPIDSKYSVPPTEKEKSVAALNFLTTAFRGYEHPTTKTQQEKNQAKRKRKASKKARQRGRK